MLRALACAALLVASCGASFCDSDGAWKTTWSEEFDGSDLDTSAWNVMVEAPPIFCFAAPVPATALWSATCVFVVR